jgi:N-acyl-D-amino-acid deacylase
MGFDIGMMNGNVVDGTGNPWFRADIGITGKRIKKVGRIDRRDCERVIDAKGKFVCPGFIDIHTHSDIAALVFPGCDSTLRQGVTTHLIGNCGLSVAPLREPFVDTMLNYWGEWAGKIDSASWRTFSEYLRVVERSGVGHNIAALVGHGAIRTAVLGPESRAPRPRELREMKGLTKEAMEAGAFGMSTGLVYPPSCFAGTEEIVELCKVVAKYDGMYASHIRGERETIADAIKEAILIGERAGVRVQISHNCPKIGAWGRTDETLGLVRAARSRGLDVTIDNDVHTDLAPTLSSALPQYMHKLSKEEMLGHISSKKNRVRLESEIKKDELPAFGPSGLLKHGKFERIIILNSVADPDLEGRSVAQVAKDRGTRPFETYFDLIVESDDEMVAIFDYIDIEDIKALLRDPNMMIASDCSTWSEKGMPGKAPTYMPCAFGEHPGIFERYVRDEPVLTMQEAVRKMTSFPAQKMGLMDRGVLRPGMRADIAIIDLARVKDRATNQWPHAHPFVNYPHRYPEGIPYVIVNGVVAVDRGRQTKALAGEVIRSGRKH